MYETILLPTDGTGPMRTVFDHTIDVADRRGATVHVLYVIDDRAFLTLQEDLVDDVLGELRTEGDEAVRTAVEALEAEGIDVESAVLKGSPADEILAYAAEHDVDLITMGTHSPDATRNLLGSVSGKVVTMSEIPVLTVRIDDED